LKSLLRNTFFLVFIAGISTNLSGQNESIYEKYDMYRNPFRVFLNKFSITGTTGYGLNFYSHDFQGMFFYQDQQDQLVFSNNVENLNQFFIGYSNWLNDPNSSGANTIDNPFIFPYIPIDQPVNNPALQDPSVLINSDTSDLGFQGTGGSIPISLSIHYSYEDLRFGFGFMYEKQSIKDLNPTSLENVVRPYQPNFKSTSYTRWFGMLGYRFYKYWNWDLIGELQLGKVKAGKAFNNEAITRGLFTNIGVSFENVWSEYFRLIIKPSIDFKRYTINLPDGGSILHKHPTFFLNVGVSINIPDIPRSPMKSDHIQLKHVYTDPKTGRRMEVRGQPITKRQNPKIGENHRKLWRYKRKNKKKLNPY